MTDAVNKTDDEWRTALTSEQCDFLRGRGTERPFSGEYVSVCEDGMYRCVGCGADLFSSSSKFDSGSGWPSFYDAATLEGVDLREDNSLGMRRTEVACQRCGSHLGHVFDDGPAPTGKRYCVNSAALRLEKPSPSA